MSSPRGLLVGGIGGITDEVVRFEGAIGGGGGVGKDLKRAGTSENVGRRMFKCMLIVRNDLLACGTYLV
jgi:hypothetical protein